mmetsp:Transcript_1492/g.2073  ORF Transcript_1492/g.2073 Transcript_1492/m.2073 type:complete len:382 (-) Transcript_1492:17-1162(-)
MENEQKTKNGFWSTSKIKSKSRTAPDITIVEPLAIRATTTTKPTGNHQEDERQQLQHQHPSNKNSSERDPIYIWSSLVAGSLSGAAASILCAPLDLIRTRSQVWGELTGNPAGMKNIPAMLQEIIAKEGWQGCFRGLGATLMTVPMFWAVYFPLYDDLKRHWSAQYPDRNKNPAWMIHMGSAVTAGAVSDVICNPMFVVRTRLQTEALHSLFDQGAAAAAVKKPLSVTQTAKALYREGGGPLIFWRGMSANLLGLSHVAIQFPVYEQLKKQLRIRSSSKSGKAENHPPAALDLLLASALSKMTASLLTYPHEVIRSRMMDSRTSVGFFEICRRIHAHEGFMGFYAGLPVTLLRVLPNTCITFMSYELLLQWAKTRIEHSRK